MAMVGILISTSPVTVGSVPREYSRGGARYRPVWPEVNASISMLLGEPRCWLEKKVTALPAEGRSLARA